MSAGEASQQTVRAGADVRRRTGLLSKTPYVSAEYLARETAMLWPRVWQMACRLEELPVVGRYLTYDIADQSILLVRTSPDEIKAYHNVCQHRGRRLASGEGQARQFHCRFHGWRWNLDGECVHIVDRDDWGANGLDEAEIRLPAVKVGLWGGFVFINMDPAAQPLEAFLGQAPGMLDCFDFASMRYRWRRATILPCNWKVALEAFNEGYHLQTTHPQLLEWFEDYSWSVTRGLHSNFGYFGPDDTPKGAPLGAGSSRIVREPRRDIRKYVAEYYAEIAQTLDAVVSATIYEAARRAPDEIPDGTPPYEAFGWVYAEAARLDAARGAPWPEVSVEQMMAAGLDWHIFPNMVFLHGPSYFLGYRARPNGDDPASCIFEAYTLERFPSGQEPEVELEWGEPGDADFWGKVLSRDFMNVGEVQKGMNSLGFAGARANPKQEQAILNFHASLARSVGDPAA